MATYTCRSVIKRSMQHLGSLNVGEDPTDNEAQDFMVSLQSLYDGWVTAGMFGTLTDVLITADYTAKENERITGNFTVTVPSTVTCEGVARTPRDLSLIETFDTVRKVYLFDRNAWVQIDSLTLNSTAPLSARSFVGLSACLAAFIADELGKPLGQGTTRLASQFRAQISMKLGSSQDRAPGEFY